VGAVPNDAKPPDAKVKDKHRLTEVVTASAEGRIAGPPTVTTLQNRRSVRADQLAARRVEALSLRMAGLTYEQIGSRLQMTRLNAMELIKVSLQEAENLAVDEMRTLENIKLDRVQASIWSKVLDGDLPSIAAFLQISNRRAKLNGLDSPTRINLSLTVQQEMESALKELEAVVLASPEVVDAALDPALDPDSH
jgi:hypothetical protein